MHHSVLLNEVVDFLQPDEGLIVDATVGLGGHAEAILRASPRIHLLGIDLDPRALESCSKRLAPFGSRVQLVQGNYSTIKQFVGESGRESVEGVLADLGLSSFQLSEAERGFSFGLDGPLDMRMGEGDLRAEDIVNTWDVTSLARIFREYGEERMAYKIAKAVVEHRPMHSTRELRDLLHRVKGGREARIDSATRIFQALRIAVNRELDHLERFIPSAVEVLAPGSRCAVISFHSLEDRIVKTLFRHLSGQCVCNRGLLCTCAPTQAVSILTRKPVRPAEEELQSNPRSRSAKMRVVEKL
ncbi:MAG TPA: 16S rRNA (cytosine(1402)-N(4))-methyltransferase RsmH [Thermoanaerobaculia bacterium]|nr:16S rRNA (cytosine(1402)-N(4))-methyltransferase RsmH [Thermoanaerobaculia bacterium]HUM29340.1 16S rRNA (cytosine(1402)-N(4))-methyltransferase RsmH [Thermoanaerobaculia bacterium]HXK67586.1 16S rRNA (cytosine(1402)-N(4))-methyltransferase RsmH [Thermoanaerobaculia bacterium]